MNYVEQIAMELAKGSDASTDMIYLPTASVGRLIHIAMSMEREIGRLDREAEILMERVNELSSVKSDRAVQ